MPNYVSHAIMAEEYSKTINHELNKYLESDNKKKSRPFLLVKIIHFLMENYLKKPIMKMFKHSSLT